MLTALIIAFVILFGLITSYEDYSKNRIRNRWILLALGFGFVLTLTMGLGIKTTEVTQMEFPFIAECFLNAVFAFLFGYLLWYIGLWSAGDAKLFLAYAFIIPPTFYTTGYLMHFPAFTLLVNTFAPFLLFFFGYYFIKSGKLLDLKLLKGLLRFRLIMSLALFVFGFSWLVEMLFSLLRIPLNFFLLVVTLFVIILGASRFLKFKLMTLSVVLSLLRLIFDSQRVFSSGFLLNFVLILVTLFVLRFYLLSLSYNLFSKEMFIEDLKEGMILAEDVYKVGENKYAKRRFANFSIVGALLKKSRGDSIFASLGDGLTAKEVEFVKRIHSRGFLKDHTIRVYHTLPFAPFMFLGALLTIILGTDVFMFIKILIESFI